MSITSIIALLIFSSGVTGAIMTMLWMAFCALGKKYLNSNIIYFASRIVIVSYYIPSMFIFLIVQDKIMDIEDTSFLFFTMILKILLTIFFIGVLVLFIREIREVIKRYKELNEICGCRIPAELDINAFKRSISDRLNIKRDVRLYMGYAVPCPFTFGIIRPAIYLPPEKIDRRHLQVLLTHELYHNKQRDFIWKPLSTITRCIHWANPFVWIASRNIERWAEASCDYRCCTKGDLDSDTYFMYLHITLDKLNELSRKYILGLEGDKTELLWREGRMEKNEEIRDRRALTAVLSICMVLAGVVSIYGATVVMNRVYYKIFMNTANMIKIDVDEENKWEEEIITLNELKEQVKKIEELELKSLPDGSGVIEGTLNTETLEIYSDIYLTEGNCFRIISTIDPQNEDVKIGMLQPDGTIRYISCSEHMSYNFDIAQSGIYEICIYNNCADDVYVFITYAY